MIRWLRYTTKSSNRRKGNAVKKSERWSLSWKRNKSWQRARKSLKFVNRSKPCAERASSTKRGWFKWKKRKKSWLRNSIRNSFRETTWSSRKRRSTSKLKSNSWLNRSKSWRKRISWIRRSRSNYLKNCTTKKKKSTISMKRLSSSSPQSSCAMENCTPRKEFLSTSGSSIMRGLKRYRRISKNRKKSSSIKTKNKLRAFSKKNFIKYKTMKLNFQVLYCLFRIVRKKASIDQNVRS